VAALQRLKQRRTEKANADAGRCGGPCGGRGECNGGEEATEDSGGAGGQGSGTEAAAYALPGRGVRAEVSDDTSISGEVRSDDRKRPRAEAAAAAAPHGYLCKPARTASTSSGCDDDEMALWDSAYQSLAPTGPTVFGKRSMTAVKVEADAGGVGGGETTRALSLPRQSLGWSAFVSVDANANVGQSLACAHTPGTYSPEPLALRTLLNAQHAQLLDDQVIHPPVSTVNLEP